MERVEREEHTEGADEGRTRGVGTESAGVMEEIREARENSH